MPCISFSSPHGFKAPSNFFEPLLSGHCIVNKSLSSPPKWEFPNSNLSLPTTPLWRCRSQTHHPTFWKVASKPTRRHAECGMESIMAASSSTSLKWHIKSPSPASFQVIKSINTIIHYRPLRHQHHHHYSHLQSSSFKSPSNILTRKYRDTREASQSNSYSITIIS